MLYEKVMDCTKDDTILLNDWIKESVADSGVKSGIAILYAPHTTSGISVTPYMLSREDHMDIHESMEHMIPTRVNYTHQFDTPSDASGHNKSAFMGVSMTMIVENGKPMMGSSQGVFFFEFDGPRKQKCYLKVISD